MKIRFNLDENNLRKASHFFSNYDMVNILSDTPEKYYLGNNKNKKCRFCGEIEPVVKFTMEAHAIPNFMGNKNLLSNFECDSCNSIFSKYEDSFARFLGVSRTLSQIKGKKGNVPKFKDSKTSLQVVLTDEGINMSSFVDDDVMEIDEKNKSFTLKTNKTTYTPIFIPKLFIKLGITMLPEEEIQNFSYTCKFLINNSKNENFKDFNLLTILSYYVPGPTIFNKPFLLLFKSKVDNLPQYVFILQYYNYQFQMIIPFGSKDEGLQGENIELPIAPLLLDKNHTDEFGKEIFKSLNLTSTIKKVNEAQNITFSYEKFEQTDFDKKNDE